MAAVAVAVLCFFDGEYKQQSEEQFPLAQRIASITRMWIIKLFTFHYL